VGGLLKVTDYVGSTTHHFVAYDGNGNVAMLTDAGTGATTARYDYGPFGELVRATGTMAEKNPFRFSTKYTDDESGFLYYGYRFYHPTTGRWLGRDPIGEIGGRNLYAFGHNNPIVGVDPLGNAWYDPSSWFNDPSPSAPPQDLVDKKNRTINVGKCQIVILFGHATAGKPWKWKTHKCSGGGASIMCWADKNSKDLAPDYDLWPPDIEKPVDEGVVWGDAGENPNDPNLSLMGNLLLADKIFDAVSKAAHIRADTLCRKACCKQVRVRYIWITKNGKIIHNPKQNQTQYAGTLIVQDFIIDCKSRSLTYVDQ
jgi:RHS repeat-associated protein